MAFPIGTLIFGVLAVISAIAGALPAQAQGEDLDALNRQVAELFQAGKYAQATPLAERALALTERRLGADHPQLAARLGDLALLYRAQGRYADAEPLYKRDLAITERAFGTDHPLVSATLINLAVTHTAQGRYAEAEPLLNRALAIREQRLGDNHLDTAAALNYLAIVYRSLAKYDAAEAAARRALAVRERALGDTHPDVASTLGNLALILSDRGHDAEAEALHKRALSVHEAAKGPEHPDLGPGLANLGALYYRQGRYTDAELTMKRAISLYEAALGAHHPDFTPLLNNLAEVHRAQSRYPEAERLYKRAIDSLEKAFGPNHPDLGTSLSNLAELYRRQGRYADAELLGRRALAIREAAFGAEHRLTSDALISLAAVLAAQGRYDDAEPFFSRSVAVLEKALGSDHRDVGTALNQLALLYRAQDRPADAERLLQRALAIYEKAFGVDHLSTATVLNNLAELHRANGRYARAEPLYRRALAIFESALGPDHPDVATILNNIAALHLGRQDWDEAIRYLRRSTSIAVARTRRGGDAIGRAPTGKAVSEAARDSLAFSLLVKAAYRLAAAGRADASTLAQEMFRTAQWAIGTEAAVALSQMAARQVKDDGALADLVRERQDLVAEWRAKDRLLIAARSAPPARRSAESEAALNQRLAAIDRRIAEIDGRLAKDFPNYTDLAATEPLDVPEVQAYLRPDEALVLFLVAPEWKPTPEETFVWVVTRTAARWSRSNLGSGALSREVAALRCGLDETAWEGAGAERCRKALGTALLKADSKPLPFDHARAHELYIDLFSGVQDLIKGKHLLIVPSGALTQLPFQVLVTDGIKTGGSGTGASSHRAAAWLARAHPVTILPAVASLKALRRVGRRNGAPRPMIGFGNPLIEGPDRRYAVHAELARTKQRCPETRRQRLAAGAGPRGGVARVEARGGLADLSHLKKQVPLPETADELCAVAHDVKAVAHDIRLGTRATEREVKRLSASGELAQYRMVHFATHGALAGELDGTREPGLILTPPETASAEDDGYLSASEIAGLKLDADWVILSACNTAAGGTDNAEALSGLARAFIYAQARALLVSHWAVDSDATVKLITAAVGEMARDASVGRAEAMRRSMLALIDRAEPHQAHPAYWAPFVVVGEGAPER
jgi:tetratricopeptide (TPR) repeat protein/CHAT domain-containing protein